MADPAATREKLLDAAARLFAERGIDNVSIAEIVRAAGQRNASAVHYHFGSRQEVLRALLARHVPAIAERRAELMAKAEEAPADDVRAAAEAIVRPVSEFAQRGWRERAYLRIGTQLAPWLSNQSSELADLMAETEGFKAWDLLRTRCSAVPDDLWEERRQICIAFVAGAAADRARQLDDGTEHPVLSDEHFVDNLVAMLVGAMTAPMP